MPHYFRPLRDPMRLMLSPRHRNQGADGQNFKCETLRAGDISTDRTSRWTGRPTGGSLQAANKLVHQWVADVREAVVVRLVHVQVEVAAVVHHVWQPALDDVQLLPELLQARLLQ